MPLRETGRLRRDRRHPESLARETDIGALREWIYAVCG